MTVCGVGPGTNHTIIGHHHDCWGCLYSTIQLSTLSSHSRGGNCLNIMGTTFGDNFSLVFSVFTSLVATLVGGDLSEQSLSYFIICCYRGWVTGNNTAYDYLGNKYCPSIYKVQNNMNIW